MWHDPTIRGFLVAAMGPGYLKQRFLKYFWSLTSSMEGKKSSELGIFLLEATEAHFLGFMKHHTTLWCLAFIHYIK